MKIITISLILLLSSCSSSQKIKDLEKQVEELMKINQEKKENDKINYDRHQTDILGYTPSLKITLPEHLSIEDNNQKLRTIKLGTKNGVSYVFTFNNKGIYNLSVSPYVKSAESVILFIDDKNNRPESLSLFFDKKDSTYKGFGRERLGRVNFKLVYQEKNKNRIKINFDIKL